MFYWYCCIYNPLVIPSSVIADIHKFCKDRLVSGVQELSSQSGVQKQLEKRWHERMLFIVKGMCLTTRLLAWTTRSEAGIIHNIRVAPYIHYTHCTLYMYMTNI